MPVYMAVIFLFHPILGFTATGGALLIVFLIALNEFNSRKPASEASQSAIHRSSLVEQGRRNAEAIRSMGMMLTFKNRWEQFNDEHLLKQRSAADSSGIFGTAIKTCRFMLQSAMLGAGAWLAILQEITRA